MTDEQAPALSSREDESDRAGHIEVRGIDYIPHQERHGQPRQLFWVWFAANIGYLYFTLGGFVLLLGLTIWQAIVVLLLGNLYWAATGFLAVSGPASGTPGVIVTRAMFGIRGNRPLSAGVGWLIAVCYEFINLALGALAGFALAERFGMGTSIETRVTILMVIAIVTFGVSIYGHATITKISPYVSVVLAVAMVFLGIFVVRHANFSYTPKAPLGGGDLLAAVFLGIATIAAVPLSWANGADYARYLPEKVNLQRVAVWTALGGFVPSVALGILGIIAGTSIDMTDAQTSLEKILPAWFYPILLAVILLSSMTSNILTAYSSGFCLQALGIRASRAWTVFLDGLVSLLLAGYVLFSSHFLTSISQALELTVIVLAPSMAVYVVDIILRRNTYDGQALHVEDASGRFWYLRGWNTSGAIAFGAGIVACALSVNTTGYESPIAMILSGADISIIIGPVVSGVVYAALWQRSLQEQDNAIASSLETSVNR